MKTVSFDATFIHASEQEDYWLVGFSDGEYDFSNYVMLQMAYTFDEGDHANGMDGEYFEYNAPSCCGYKYVEKAVLHKESIVFFLHDFPDAIERIEIKFQDVSLSPQALEYLKRILNGKLSIREATT